VRKYQKVFTFSKMTRWNYFLTLQSILTDCPVQCSIPVTASDGCTLRWDPEYERLVAWGTPFWWKPHGLISNMIVATQPYIRTQLSRSVVGTTAEYGLHLLVKSNIMRDILPEAEIALSRVLYVWQDHITQFYNRPPILDPSGTVFRPGRRECTKRLSHQQQLALNWMLENEAQSGHPRAIMTDIPVNDHIYSFEHNMFINTDRKHYEHVYIASGALTGHRGAGKTLIAKHLLDVPIPGTTMFPEYAYESSLIVVPTHLVEYWKSTLDNAMVVGTEIDAKAWVREVPPRPVITTYDVLSKLIRHTHNLYGNFITSNIAKRNKNHHIAIDTVEWSRVIFDELGVFSTSSILNDTSAKFKWVFQGGISTLEELNLVKSMYSSEISSVDLTRMVIYNNLPCVTPFQFEPKLTIKVHLDAFEERLSMGVNSMYSKYNTFTPRICDKWKNLSLSEEDEDSTEDEESCDVEEDTFHSSNWMDPDSQLVPLIDDLDQLSRMMLGRGGDVEMDVEEDSESGDVQISDEFFTEQVKNADEKVSVCAVCMDTECDTMFRCGHMICYTCVCPVMDEDVPRCPHCRYRINDVFTTRKERVPTTYTVLLDLLRTLKLDETIILGCDADGVGRIKQFIHQHLPAAQFMHIDETAGVVRTDVHHVVLLDASALIPVTFSHPYQVINRHVFEMVPASPESGK